MNGILRSGGTRSRSAGDRMLSGLCTPATLLSVDVAVIAARSVLSWGKRVLDCRQAAADERLRGLPFLARIGTHKLILLGSVLALAAPIQSMALSDALLTTNSSFVVYLRNPPWIR